MKTININGALFNLDAMTPEQQTVVANFVRVQSKLKETNEQLKEISEYAMILNEAYSHLASKVEEMTVDLSVVEPDADKD